MNPVQSKNHTQVAMRLKINQVQSKNCAWPMVTQIKDNTKPFLPLVTASGVKRLNLKKKENLKSST